MVQDKFLNRSDRTVTVNARGGLKTLSLQYSVCTCVKLGADEWLYIGPAT